jgi:pimeloyl-ACP methyl ester carboxylesterase
MIKSPAIVIFFLIGAASSFRLADLFKSDPDEFVPTMELIRNKGYVAEEHQAVTKDGYKLTMHRIPHGRNNRHSNQKNRPVALLQHGLLDVDSSWVANFPDQSLGFILADAGYDVWLGNVRGNTYGLGHETLNTSEAAFWDFSWDEMAEYDLPAMIDLALQVSGQASLFYIGHSQGTMIGFSKFGERELASKVRLFLALGPVATLNHIQSPIRYLADLGIETTQRFWYMLFGYKDFLPSRYVLFCPFIF